MDINVIRTCNQTRFDREITAEQYERAQANKGYLTKGDAEKVLTDSERLGYGASAGSVYELDGRFYVRCSQWNSCD